MTKLKETRIGQKSPDQVYDELITEGAYEEANLDLEELAKMFDLASVEYEFGKRLRSIHNPNWRVIFNIHYDVIRELCDILIKFKKQKISNHQGLFAFITLNYPELELNWAFLEEIRTLRNRNKYMGIDITQEHWKKSELETDLNISALINEIKRLMLNQG